MQETNPDRLNFRVKVDLSQFYNDARKLSYVYIDKMKMSNVLHLQTKIQNIFGITRSLHLVVNDVFLPVNEDIRIIEKDEVVMVQASRVTSNSATTTLDTVNKIQNNDEMNGELESHYEKQQSDCTDVEIFENSKPIRTTNDVQIIESHTVESEIPRKKRKRVRRRKKNSNTEISSPINITQQNESLSISHQVRTTDIEKSKSKHLKFYSDDSDEIEKPENKKITIIRNNNKEQPSSKPVIRSVETTSLGSLLSLRNSQIPLTFSGQRRSRTNSNASSFTTKSSTVNGSPVNMNISSSSMNILPSNSHIDYSRITIDSYPIHKEKFLVNDVIAFQTLILNDYYCPVLSKYIVAKVISNDSLTDSYTFEILAGGEQLKTPDGKFTLPMDNEEEESVKKTSDNGEWLTLGYSQLHEPRLIERSA